MIMTVLLYALLTDVMVIVLLDALLAKILTAGAPTTTAVAPRAALIQTTMTALRHALLMEIRALPAASAAAASASLGHAARARAFRAGSGAAAEATTTIPYLSMSVTTAHASRCSARDRGTATAMRTASQDIIARSWERLTAAVQQELIGTVQAAQYQCLRTW
jgi:hypothetical protein